MYRPNLRELGDNAARHQKQLAGLEEIVKGVEGLGYRERALCFLEPQSESARLMTESGSEHPRELIEV
jgi:hypothetical protein